MIACDYHFRAMGTSCSIVLYADNPVEADAVAALVLAEIERIEFKYSRYRADSELSRINGTLPGQICRVDEETSALLDYAMACFRISDGLFDITSGVLRRAWNFSSLNVPSDDVVTHVLGSIGMDKLSWQAPCLAFHAPDMELDFGGIAKEYAVDRAAAVITEAGLCHGLINLGGDMAAIGPRGDGSPWPIGLQHPNKKAANIAKVGLIRGALATSGNYERFIQCGATRYGHILNPKTGWPVSGLASVSVLAPQCMVAGSGATIAMLKGTDGASWLAQHKLDHIWIDEDGHQGGTWPPVWSSSME